MTAICPKCRHENPEGTVFCGKCGTPLPPQESTITKTMETPKEELTTGFLFAKRYQIIEELGKGGMGRVYRAVDKKLNEEVAIKLIKPEIASDKKTIQRFSNEVKLARKIAHKNIGRMYELMDDKGTHFITMEYVPGEDLKSFIRRAAQLGVILYEMVTGQVPFEGDTPFTIGIKHKSEIPKDPKELNTQMPDELSWVDPQMSGEGQGKALSECG